MHGADEIRQAGWDQLGHLGIEHLVLWNSTVRDPRLRDSRRRAKYALRMGDAIAFHIHGPVQVSLPSEGVLDEMLENIHKIAIANADERKARSTRRSNRSCVHSPFYIHL